jgi:hypothetical protein
MKACSGNQGGLFCLKLNGPGDVRFLLWEREGRVSVTLQVHKPLPAISHFIRTPPRGGNFSRINKKSRR